MSRQETATVEIPPLFCPIPAADIPDTSKISSNVLEWMGRFGFCDTDVERTSVAANLTAEWASRIAPNGAIERLQISADWACLGLTMDDAFPDGGAHSHSPELFVPFAVRVLRSADHPESNFDSDPYCAGFQDISRRIRENASATVVRRWADGVAEWFFGTAVGLSQRVRGVMPSLEDYFNVGARDRGTRASLAVIELAEGTSLPNSDMENPRMRALTQIASTLVTIGNDVYSYHREVQEGSLESNIVGVLMHWDNLRAPEAMAKAAAIHDRLMCLYMALYDQTKMNAGPEVRLYLDQLSNFIRGNLDYSAVTPRYKVLPTDVSGRATADWADSPSDGRLTPLPLPAVAWWWDELNRLYRSE